MVLGVKNVNNNIGTYISDGDPCFDLNGPTRRDQHHGLTESLHEVRVNELNPRGRRGIGWQSTCDSITAYGHPFMIR